MRRIACFLLFVAMLAVLWGCDNEAKGQTDDGRLMLIPTNSPDVVYSNPIYVTESPMTGQCTNPNCTNPNCQCGPNCDCGNFSYSTPSYGSNGSYGVMYYSAPSAYRSYGSHGSYGYKYGNSAYGSHGSYSSGYSSSYGSHGGYSGWRPGSLLNQWRARRLERVSHRLSQQLAH